MVSASAISNITAIAFLDKLGRYAKDDDQWTEARCFTGVACDYISLTRAEFQTLTREQRISLKGLSGRPECIDTSGKSNA